jgi:predicted nuclease of predicted toxin-antitoxin system
MSSKHSIKFLADESCDFTVVRSLRAAGYDVLTVTESFPSVPDLQILKFAVEEERILLTEDKDFGEWIFSQGEAMNGVLLIRFPAKIRSKLGEAIKLLVAERGFDLIKSFTVLEPGRARIRKQK